MNFLKNLASELLDDQENFTNLTEVAVVDSDACLSVLSKRFAQNSIYTHCGPLLVAVNPYCELPELYDEEAMAWYQQLLPAENPLPHVFELASRVYGRAMAEGLDQSVVISGESGAGKTETAKYLLRYFADASCSMESNLHERVIGTNPITESFGCARTVRNDNSSRFGKFVQLLFSPSGRLLGADLQTYLLEKSRVVSASAKESNFHVFYEACQGVRNVPVDGMRDHALPLFEYIQQSLNDRCGEHDLEHFSRTRDALFAIGLDPAGHEQLIEVLLAILYLGNIDFGTGEQAAVADAQSASCPLEVACRLLRTSTSKLQSGMCLRRFKAGAEWVSTSNTSQEASDVRHAFAKQLYSALFNWLIRLINAALSVDRTAGGQHHAAGPRIGCVDIFGFEIFAENSLEQLCINFANEKLQRLFIGVLFEAAQAQYREEGIPVEGIECPSNQGIVDLIGGTPTSLMALLTEECIFPKGSDILYLQKVVRAHRDHSSFKEIKSSPTSFALRHFAGEVTYTVSGFLPKNKDPVSQDLLVLMQSSSCAFVSSLFKDDAHAQRGDQPAGKGAMRFKSSKFVGVVDHFQGSLRSLVATLQAGDLHFVRCLKPNDAKRAGHWERSVVLRQLQSSGLVHAVHASRAGFADHLTPGQVVAQFGPLIGQPDLGPDPNASATSVLTACGFSEEHYAVGHTKIFLKQGVLQELQRQRLEFVGERVCVVQAMMRGFVGRRRVHQLREERRRQAEERARRDAERRLAEERRRRELEEARRRAEEERVRLEEEERERRRQVQKARSLSFDRRRRKAREEEEALRRNEELQKAEKRRELELRRAEAEERHRQRLAREGVTEHGTPACEGAASTAGHDGLAGEDEAVGTSQLAAQTPSSEDPTLQAPLPSDDLGGAVREGSDGGAAAQVPTPSVDSQRVFEHLRDSNQQFVCPLGDVVAYAAYIGMDLDQDLDLLWIADEALQAPEPAGWEERQDPNGGIYFFNPTTGMSMLQHPVDYHYHQIYLQTKQEKGKIQRQASTRGDRRSSKGFRLDLRSVNADDEPGDPGTPVGWLKRAKSLLTPRGSPAGARRGPSSAEHEFITLTATVSRNPMERLGMELNAYNQVLALVPGSPCDRCQAIHVHDRVVSIDDQVLGDRLLSDVLTARREHSLVLERYVARPDANAGRASPRSLFGRSSAAEVASPSVRKSRGKKPPLPPGSPAVKFDRFQVIIPRGPAGLGIVCDESSVVVDMVPGSTADLQRAGESKSEPRLQIGDRIVCVDSKPLNGQALDDIIAPASRHTFLVERPKQGAPGTPAASKWSSALKVLTPRPSTSESAGRAKPSRALREVQLNKPTQAHRLGIRFVRDDDGFDREYWASDLVQPVVTALDPAGEAAAAGVEVDDMVLSINGQTGLTNTQAASQLRDLSGTITLVLRKANWIGSESQGAPAVAETPRSAMRRLV